MKKHRGIIAAGAAAICITILLVIWQAAAFIMFFNNQQELKRLSQQEFAYLEELPRGAQAEDYIPLFRDYGIGGPTYSYIVKQEQSRGGIVDPGYEFDLPYKWEVGTATWEDCLQSYFDPDDDVKVYGHVTENRFARNEFSADWEDFVTKVREGSEIYNTNDQIENLQVERYSLKSGLDLYFFTFSYYGEYSRVDYAVAYLLGDYHQAEFIGMKKETADSNEDIADITRYIAATYIEKDEYRSRASLKTGPYTGEENWPWETFHNPFALASKMYGKVEEPELEGKDYQVEIQSELLEDLVRKCVVWHFHMDDEEEEEFMGRQLRAIDIAWITNIILKEHPVPGRDTLIIGPYTFKDDSVVELNLEELGDLLNFTNLQTIELELGGIEDFHRLAELQYLTDVTIKSGTYTHELGWVKEMPQLVRFSYRSSNKRDLSSKGYIKDGGTTFGAQEGYESLEDEVSDISVFKECQNLEYLEIEVDGMPDLSFLAELDNLYTFRMYGEDSESEAADARRALFANDAYPQIRCLIIDEEWLRNPA